MNNAGPEAAGGVTLFAGIADDPGTGASATIINYGGCIPQSTQFVICPLGTLDAGTSSDVTLTVQAHALEGEISAEATVVIGGDDPNPGNDTDTETTTISSDAPPTVGADQIMSMSAPTSVRAARPSATS